MNLNIINLLKDMIISRKVLITNEDYDFKLFIEYIKEEIREDKLILYFKVLESYNYFIIRGDLSVRVQSNYTK